MRSNFTQLYLHYVWATWDRLRLITPDIQQIVYAAIVQQAKNLGCPVIAVGGIADHVHLLVGFLPTLTVSELLKQVKGSSSHFITNEIKPGEFFKWQGAYGAFTVSQGDRGQVAGYIENQAAHHQKQSIINQWERLSSQPIQSV
jgi:REP element-mobilizing transposase RayT